jgi:hypothetical protein
VIVLIDLVLVVFVVHVMTFHQFFKHLFRFLADYAVVSCDFAHSVSEELAHGAYPFETSVFTLHN